MDRWMTKRHLLMNVLDIRDVCVWKTSVVLFTTELEPIRIGLPKKTKKHLIKKYIFLRVYLS